MFEIISTEVFKQPASSATGAFHAEDAPKIIGPGFY
jgi:hypothetical protein